eukprot:scaffold223824_cov21-Tisochrysis_lutea.AAC.1
MTEYPIPKHYLIPWDQRGCQRISPVLKTFRRIAQNFRVYKVYKKSHQSQRMTAKQKRSQNLTYAATGIDRL